MEIMDTEVALGDAGAPVESEKMLPVSRVNEIVKKEKAHAAEKVARELEAKHKAEIERLTASSHSMGGMEQYSPEQLGKLIDERVMQIARQQDESFKQEQHEENIRKQASKYFMKMEGGNDSISDFNEVMKGFKPDKFSDVSLLAAEMDNTPAIMYELVKNPLKLSNLNRLIQDDPEMAYQEMKKLSRSIADNKAAKEAAENINEPLSRMKSSNVGVDSGNMDVRSLRKSPSLRA